MQKGLSIRFEQLRPAINERWSALLHEKPAGPPATTALVQPEMLVFMLDDTLARLCASLSNAPLEPRKRHDLIPFGETRLGCRCGLHLLLTYYLCGARALRETLPVEFGQERVEVLHRFNRLAHDEMAVLCEICQHRGGAVCGLQQKSAMLAGLDFVTA